jgi:hypothetical protein
LQRPTLRSVFTRDRSGQVVVAVSGLVFVGCLIAGFRLDRKSMTINLLAGLACTGLGVLVAVWVVDRYIRHAARLRWAKVDVLTYRAIAAHVCDAMVQLLIDTTVLKDMRPLPSIQAGRDEPDAKTIEGLSELASLLRAVPNPGSNDLSDAAITFYENSKWDLDQVCDSLLPRLIEYSDAHDLINSLIEFDAERRALHTSIIAHQQAVTGGVFVHLPTLVDASANVYRILLKHWLLPQTLGAD